MGRDSRLIACGVLVFLVVLIKLIGLILRLIVDSSIALSESESTSEEQRPESIPPDIWELRHRLVNPSPNLETVVSDLLAGGTDQEGLMALIDYVKGENPVDEVGVTDERGSDEVLVIPICGRVLSLPFGRTQINSVFPMNHSIWYIIMAAVFGFSAAYLPLSLQDQMKMELRWWIGIVQAIAIYSILEPPVDEPYLMTCGDFWSGLCRPVGISLIATIWRVAVRMSGTSTKMPVFGWVLVWDVINPYLFDICTYGLALFPFWVILNMFGHPVSQIMAILEAFNRYTFGQCGITSPWHWLRQFLRGAASVAIAWAILRYSRKGAYFGLAIALVTFVNLIPLKHDKVMWSLWPVTIGIPLMSGALSYIVCYGIVSRFPDKADIVRYFALSWTLLMEIVFPYLYSCNNYFLVHMLVLHGMPAMSAVRLLSTTVVTPLAIGAILFESDMSPLWIAFIMTHAVQKANTEIHWFSWALLITCVTLPFEFSQGNISRNFLFSLLFITKAEVVLPFIETVFRTRSLYTFGEASTAHPSLSITLHIPWSFLLSAPFADFLIKIPALIWSSITGAGMSAWFGFGFLLTVGPSKPFYFFDWPVQQTIDDMNKALTKVRSEHPIEAPVYNSASRTLAKHFGSLVKSGKLGYVSAGDMFVMKSEQCIIIVHVIAVESNIFKIQMRGLEWQQVTSCHIGEAIGLQNMIDTNVFASFSASIRAMKNAYRLRAREVPLETYVCTKTLLSESFIGAETDVLETWFFVAFCVSIVKSNIRGCYTGPVNPEDQEQLNRFLRTQNRELFATLLEHFNVDIDENTRNDFLLIWAIFARFCLSTGAAGLNFDGIAAAFRGSVRFPDEYGWMYNSSVVVTDLLVPATQLGCGYAFFASSLIAPEIENGNIEEVAGFITWFDALNVVTSIESDAFTKAYFQEKKRILCIQKIDEQDYFMSFNIELNSWTVFLMRREWVRALWQNEIKGIMFYKTRNSERVSIQENPEMLNNLIIQSCDPPVGYPAYVSGIMDSYALPVTTEYYETNDLSFACC